MDMQWIIGTKYVKLVAEILQVTNFRVILYLQEVPIYLYRCIGGYQLAKARSEFPVFIVLDFIFLSRQEVFSRGDSDEQYGTR